MKHILHALKHNMPCEVSPVVPVYQEKVVIATLRVVSEASLKDPSEIKRLALWRKQNDRFFPTQFKVTIAGTKKWSQNLLLNKEDRILFMIEDLSGRAIGHVGLDKCKKSSGEIDNVIRGVRGIDGLMTAAIQSLCTWGREMLGIQSYSLQVHKENVKAISLYRRCGFVKATDTTYEKNY